MIKYTAQEMIRILPAIQYKNIQVNTKAEAKVLTEYITALTPIITASIERPTRNYYTQIFDREVPCTFYLSNDLSPNIVHSFYNEPAMSYKEAIAIFQQKVLYLKEFYV